MFARWPSIKSRFKPRFSFASTLSILALFFALTGGAYAALELPSNSVGTRQIKNGAVTLNKINHSTRHELSGAKGPKGNPGPQGPKGDEGAPGHLGVR